MTLTAPRPVRSAAPPPAPALPATGPERRRSTPTLRSSDYFAVVGALVAAVSVTALLFAALAPLRGRLGFLFERHEQRVEGQEQQVGDRHERPDGP